MSNPNRYTNDWFSDGCYFAEGGEVIHTADGRPLCYFDENTNTFHSHADGRIVFYYDTFGNQLFRYTKSIKRQCNQW